MLAWFEELGPSLEKDDLQAVTFGHGADVYYRHTFMFDLQLLGQLEQLFEPIRLGNRYYGSYGRLRHCYKRNTILRAYLIRQDDDGNELDRWPFVIARRFRWNDAFAGLEFATDRLLDLVGTTSPSAGKFDYVVGVEAESLWSGTGHQTERDEIER